MSKLMSRYKGLFLSCVSVMLIAVCVCSFSIESRASTSESIKSFPFPYGQPSTGDGNGYVELLLKNKSTGAYAVFVYSWNVCTYDSNNVMSSYDTAMDLEVYSSSSTLTFTGSCDMNLYGQVTILEITDSGLSHVLTSSSFSSGYYTQTRTLPSYTILNYHVYGNFASVYDDMSAYGKQEFVVQYGSETQILAQINMVYNAVLNANTNLGGKLDNLISHMNTLVSELGLTNELLEVLNSLVESYGVEIVEQQKQTNSWLEKIWNSIQEFFNPNEEDSSKSEELENETTEKSDTLDDLNEQNKTDKTDIDSASNSVDENIDLDSIDNYGTALATITENQYILEILLLVFSVALVAYVLFGKR